MRPGTLWKLRFLKKFWKHQFFWPIFWPTFLTNFFYQFFLPIKILLFNVFTHEQLKVLLLFLIITLIDTVTTAKSILKPQILNILHTNCKIEKQFFQHFVFWKRLVKALDFKITLTVNFQIKIYSFLKFFKFSKLFWHLGPWPAPSLKDSLLFCRKRQWPAAPSARGT